ncbi:MAG: cathepsin D [Amphiamblys sp. WSBS2006]|nr:MAG: cathepsin D [Amphiamblys sp. WSBS2006]
MYSAALLSLLTSSFGCMVYIPLRRVQRDVPEKEFIGENKFVGPVYLGVVKIGENTLETVFDTTNPNIWAISSTCKSGICLDRRFTNYDIEKSPPASSGDELFVYKEDRNSIKAHISRDVLQIGKLQITGQAFGEVTKLFGPAFQERLFDCVFGLGGKAPFKNTTPFLDNISSLQHFNRNVVGIWLPNPEHSLEGELVLGGVDTKKLAQTPFFIPTRRPGHWSATITAILYGEHTLVNNDRVAVFSTAAYLISAPEDDSRHIHKILGFWKEKNLYRIECSKVEDLKSITFNIGGEQIELKPREYTFVQKNECFSGIVASRGNPSDEKTWSFGTLFMQSYYTIFNADASTLGFARSF